MSTIQPNLRPAEPLGGGLTPGLLGYGSRGTAVREVQAALTRAGYNPGAVDGVFGGETLEAVRAFQADRGLEVDGLVGSRTRRVLEAAGKAPAEPGAIDTRSTWQTGASNNIIRNFGHRPVDGAFVHARPDGRMVWSDSQTLVNKDQWAAMGAFQRNSFLHRVPEA
ncbi:MAG: peptidoglycan-binding domain-containing protein, partial [Candidatus Sericytochromatia bacterium]|nr:peptidoglycan-binding domain-containing protein [Candidatus Sericytochromatia bacterium]